VLNVAGQQASPPLIFSFYFVQFIASRRLHCSCVLCLRSIFYWSLELDSASPQKPSIGSSMRSRASWSTHRNSLRDICTPLPRRLVEGLESSRVELPVGNKDDERRRLMGTLEWLDSESLLGRNGMLFEGFGWMVA
jgi:hypothetical protein